MYKLILMDADDTLFDYPKAEDHALTQALKHYNIENDHLRLIEDYRKINHQLWVDLEKGKIEVDSLKIKRFRDLFDKHALAIQPDDFSRTYLYYLGKSVFLLEFAEDICSYLHEKYQIVIVTNGFEVVQIPRVKESSLAPYISQLIISEVVGASKPDSRIFDYALKQCNILDKSEVLMIGDSFSADIMGGMTFGIDTCWYNPHKKPLPEVTTGKKPTFIIQSLLEIKSIL